MASLATHFSATLILLPIGLRRLICSSSLYLKNPSLFTSKTWYFSDPKWKNIDLYILLIALPIASFSQVFIFFSFTAHPIYRFSFLNQSLLLFLFWVLSILFLLHSTIHPFAINDSLLFVSTGVVFAFEYLVIGKGISGVVAEAVYGLSKDLTLVCCFCCLYLAVRPSGFFAEFCLSCVLVVKGSWFLQSGLCLYTDVFGFNGCHKVVVLPRSVNAVLRCDLEEDGLRGVALVKLLFVGHVIGILLFSLGIFGLLSSNRNLRHGEGSGPLLAGLESDSALMRSIPEFELE